MPKKVLIVEDEEFLRQALVNRLTRDGFEAVGASNGEEGLALALKHHPDLILADILMPKMDGFAMLEQLRKDPWGKTASVVILSNVSDPENIARAIEMGGHEYWVKTDMKPEEWIEKIKEKLRSL